MARKNEGLVHLRVDTGAREVDRQVHREVDVVYRPTSSYSDRAIRFETIRHSSGEKVRIVVSQQRERGGSYEVLFETDVEAHVQ